MAGAVPKYVELLFFPAPNPPTPLGRYRILSPQAGVRVSPLQMGTMALGTEWGAGLGNVPKEQAFALLDAYYDAGGNFFDSANNYHMEQSEAWLGEWMETRGVRDLCVVATKFSANHRVHDLGKGHSVNYAGNSKVSMLLSVRDSLKKLRTDRIDILYVHFWDYTTSIEEVMDGLHQLVEQGKVLYLGVSNTPAWVVAAANTYAKAHGKTPFVIYQGQWSVLLRDLEREIVPMCRQFGMALAPYGAAGGGKFKTPEQVAARQSESGGALRNGGQQTPEEEKMSAALAKVGEALGGKSVTAVAIAYLMAKAPYVFPIIGARKLEYLEDNIEALNIQLSKEQIAELEAVQKFEMGWPHNIIGDDIRITGTMGAPGQSSAQVQVVRYPTAIGYEA